MTSKQRRYSQTLKKGALLVAAIVLVVSCLVAGCTTEQSPEEIWLSGLMTYLQNDTTDANNYTVDIYEDEHFARDLEDNLEELDYDVAFLTVFEFDGVTLHWVPLLKLRYSEAFAVLVNPRTDDIVTEAYDGDGDGVTKTLVGMDLTGVSSWLDGLLATGLGNDGQYLIFGFDDYETVRLVDTAVAKNLTELMKDLAENDISEREWVEETYDCDDFARDLEDALEALGYRVTVKAVYYKVDDALEGHAVINVHLEDRVVTIEPATDTDVTSVYDGDGDGEVESASPGLVRSQAWILGFWRDLPLCGGTDGQYLIFEYEDFDDIPFPVDSIL